MADVQGGQGAGTDAVLRWRAPLETTALLLMAAIGVSIVGGIVSSVFSADTSAWEKLAFLGFNVVQLWHVAVLVVAVALVLALRIPFERDARGAAMARLALLDVMVLGGVIALCALLGIIGTIGRSADFGPTIPEKIGEILQLLGGGAVAAAAAMLALRGQSLLPAPVRPAAPVAAPPSPAPQVPTAPATPATPTTPTTPAAAGPGSPGWAADPFGRHQWRYWDGTRWTDQVADGSTQSTDPAR
jgi:hypothetical protein